jgi:hypothetical protein
VIILDTIAKTLKTGNKAIANRLSALRLRLVQICSRERQMKTSTKLLTTEQLDARARFIILMTFCGILVAITLFFLYGVIFVEQPMSKIAPADALSFEILKVIAVQIFSVLTLILGNKAANSFMNSTPKCPSPTIKQEEKLISAIEGKPLPSKPSLFGNPNERPPL